MKIGKVTSMVSVKKAVPALEGERVVMVEMEGNTVAALDKAQAAVGERVLVVMSHAAGKYSMESPSDAVVVAVVN